MDDTPRPTSSQRDPDAIGASLTRWLSEQTDSPEDLALVDVDKPDGNGMSSDTVLFTLRWGGSDRPMVARIEPRLDDVPVFPSYDLDLQRRAMTLVDETTTAPVPKPVFWSDDPAIVGAPFFLMDRIDGRVPPDVLPYTFPGDGWLLNASTDEHRRLERSAVTALAAIHEVTPETHDLTFVRSPVTGRSVLEDHLDRWTEYSRWVTAESPSPLLEEAFAWLRDNLPTGLGPERLAWGDARIGNMIFQGFDVAAVLDWEMVDVAPPEIDLGWMAYLHRFFQDLTTDLGEAGLPDLLRPTTLRGLYEDATDRKVGDLRWPMAYAAIRHGAIMRRVGERLVQFGQQERPDDPDDLIMHGRQIRAMLDGSYWDTVDL